MFLAALAATAQTRMSVDSCMRYAANHNLDVRAARISLSDSRLDQQSALASTLPSVGAQIAHNSASDAPSTPPPTPTTTCAHSAIPPG